MTADDQVSAVAFEIDFLPVENEQSDSTKSGDAIAARLTLADGSQRVLVVDGGFTDIGDNIVKHIRTYYGTDDVDIVISTHPDADHINGLRRVLENLNVGELLIHNPRNHLTDVSDFSNIEAVDDLIALARESNVVVTEPFQGLSRWNGTLIVLGPSQEYYRQLMTEYVAEEKLGIAGMKRKLASLRASAGELLRQSLPFLPAETLTELGETSPRNNSSVITLLTVDGDRIMLTGDAGVPALDSAADCYEFHVGPLRDNPLHTFQAPHHGSRRNLAPSILDRLLGPQGAPYAAISHTPVSSAKSAPKHPSPKVVNALARRGGQVVATEGKTICVSDGSVSRSGWVPLSPLPPLDETEDDE